MARGKSKKLTALALRAAGAHGRVGGPQHDVLARAAGWGGNAGALHALLELDSRLQVLEPLLVVRGRRAVPLVLGSWVKPCGTR